MNAKELAEKWAFDPRNVRVFGEQVVVTSSCLYPSRSSVAVTIEGSKETFVVHDAGRAVFEAGSSNARFITPASIIRPIAKSFGLQVTDSGVIRTDRMEPSEVGAGIIMVANASRDAAYALINRFKPPAAVDADEIVREILHKRFSEDRIHKDFQVIGASSKSHKFNYAVEFDNGSQLLVDVVKPDPSSINSAIVASIDLSQKVSGPARLITRMVYDDQRPWKPEDLSLLSVAGQPIQLSSFTQAVDRLAA